MISEEYKFDDRQTLEFETFSKKQRNERDNFLSKQRIDLIQFDENQRVAKDNFIKSLMITSTKAKKNDDDLQALRTCLAKKRKRNIRDVVSDEPEITLKPPKMLKPDDKLYNEILNHLARYCYQFENRSDKPIIKNIIELQKVASSELIPHLSEIVDVVAEENRIISRENEFKILQSNEWFNDNIINDFFAILLSNRSKYGDYFMSTDLLQLISVNEPDYYKLLQEMQTNVQHWMTETNRTRRVFIPVNKNKNHWFLLVFNYNPMKKQFGFEVYDSMQEANVSAYYDFINRVFLFFQVGYIVYNNKIFSQASNMTCKIMKCPQQKDSHSCGPYICKFAENIVNNVPNDNRIEPMDEREYILALIKSKIDGNRVVKRRRSDKKKKKTRSRKSVRRMRTTRRQSQKRRKSRKYF